MPPPGIVHTFNGVRINPRLIDTIVLELAREGAATVVFRNKFDLTTCIKMVEEAVEEDGAEITFNTYGMHHDMHGNYYVTFRLKLQEGN